MFEPSSAKSTEHTAKLAHIRAIFFDLDDTLCGYWDACKAALYDTFHECLPHHDTDQVIGEWAAAFRSFSPTIKGEEWYAKYLISGEPTRTEQMRLTLARLGIEDETLANYLSDTYMQKRDAHLHLFDGAEDLLKKLSARYPLGLITNGPADIQRQEIATLKIGFYFKHVFIEGEMGRGKPHPEVFGDAADAVQMKPEQILFVGNSYGHDIRPALEAGWHAVWVRRASDIPPSATGETAKIEQMPDSAPRPDAIITHLDELLPLLGL